MSDLIQRLRECHPPVLVDAEMCEEAADALEAKDAEIADLNGRIDQAIKNIDGIVALIKKIPTGSNQA